MMDFLVVELDALRTIEERLDRLTLGLGIVGSILSELPTTPSRLLDTITRVSLRNVLWVKSPDTRTRDTGIRVSDTNTVTPGIMTRRTHYIYIYIKNIDI